jgi:hypothetical protein
MTEFLLLSTAEQPNAGDWRLSMSPIISIWANNNRNTTQQSIGGVFGEGNRARRGDIEGKMMFS